MKNRKNRKGFTLVELVIVIGVIGILAGILIPTFVGVTQKAENARIRSDLGNAYTMYVADAADGWVDDENGNPTSVELEFLDAAKIGFSKSATASGVHGYTYDSVHKTWNVELAALTLASGVTSPLGGSTNSYNEYYVWKLA